MCMCLCVCVCVYMCVCVCVYVCVCVCVQNVRVYLHFDYKSMAYIDQTCKVTCCSGVFNSFHRVMVIIYFKIKCKKRNKHANK